MNSKVEEEIKTRIQIIKETITAIQETFNTVIQQITRKSEAILSDLKSQKSKYKSIIKSQEVPQEVLENLKSYSLISSAKPMKIDLSFIDRYLSQPFIEEEGKGLDIDMSYKDINQIKSLLLEKAGIILESHFSEVSSLSLHNKVLISAGKDKFIRLWNLETSQQFACVPSRSIINSISKVQNNIFVTGGEDKQIRIWDYLSMSNIFSYSSHSGPVTSVILSRSSDLVFSASTDKTVLAYSISEKKVIFSMKLHTFPVWALCLSADENFLFSGAGGKELSKKDYSICVWDLQNKRCLSQLQGHEDNVTCLAISTFLYSGSRDSKIIVWSIENFQPIQTLKGHSNWITALVVSPDNKLLCSGSADNTIRTWLITDHSPKDLLVGHTHIIKSLVIFDSFLVSASADRSIRSWNLLTKSSEIFQGHSDIVNCVAFTSDKKWAVSGGKDKTVRIWNLRKKTQDFVLEGHTGEVQSIAFCKDNDRFVTAGDKTLRVWKMSERKAVEVLNGHGSSLYCLALSKDDRFAVSGGGDLFNRDYSVRLWDLEKMSQEFAFKGHRESVYVVCFTSDFRLVVSGGYDKEIRVWDIGEKICKWVLAGHRSTIYKVLASEDSKVVMSSSRDGEYWVWDIELGISVESFSTLENSGKWKEKYPESSYFFV